MERKSLHLRCTRCKTSLGVWRHDVDKYVCAACGEAYLRENGILDFISKRGSSYDEDLAAGQMSSFAKPTTETSEWEVLSLRLRPLFGKNHSKTGAGILNGAPEEGSGMMLDIGCGYGGLAASAATRFRLVVGVDADLEQLESARFILGERFPENLVLIRAWGEDLPFMPGQFNAVTCVQALEHVLNPQAVIAQIRLGLAPLGRLYLSVPNRFTLRREPHTNLRWIGYLPHGWATHYAIRSGKDKELQGVHFFSASTLSSMVESAFGGSFEFIRSGCHRSALGRLAKIAWNMPLLSKVTAHLVGDLEVIAWN
jgi:SAM-dependent methyltransferase